jgi:alpha-beta hydrolase superfamily lysophospholipase
LLENAALSATGWFLVALPIIVGLGYAAAAYAASRYLTRPTRYKPLQTPSEFGLAWEPAVCRTTDGFQLAGWVLKPPAPRATVVLHHGLRGSREQTLGRAVLLARAGYRCVAFDHRGHGESAGGYTSFGYHEGRDAAAVLDFVRERWPDQPRAVLGMSMGAAAICFAAESTRDYDAVILESLYHDIAGAFAARLTTMYPNWLRPLVPGIVWITERRLGVRLARVAPAEYVGRISPTPVLLLTGIDDDHAHPATVQRLFERCGEPRELWLVPGAHHTDVLEVAGDLYAERVLDFLERRLPRK